jgi:hypothetical protein
LSVGEDVEIGGRGRRFFDFDCEASRWATERLVRGMKAPVERGTWHAATSQPPDYTDRAGVRAAQWSGQRRQTQSSVDA